VGSRPAFPTRSEIWLNLLEKRETELAREHDAAPVIIEQVRRATLALTQAAGAIPEDRMLVPDRLAKSLRHLLVIYVIAERLDAGPAPRSRHGDQR